MLLFYFETFCAGARARALSLIDNTITKGLIAWLFVNNNWPNSFAFQFFYILIQRFNPTFEVTYLATST